MGRSLATLLVAWVAAAMVASVFLRWRYMWITLAVLALLFLIACGYAAFNARRSHERIVCRSGGRHIVRRRRHSLEHIQTVSRVVDSNHVVEPPSYQTSWITDLPPSYSAVVRTQPPTSIPNYHLTSADELPIGPRLSNPPPYTVAIESDTLTSQNGQPTNRTLEPNVQNFQAINQPGGQPWPLESGHHIVRRQCFSEISQPNEDKEPKEHRRSQSTGRGTGSFLSTGTGYLSNIISCTFARGERRTNVNRNDHQTVPTNEQRISTNQINSGSNNTCDLKMNLFSTCGDENISSGRHHVEIYPGPPMRNFRKISDYDESLDALADGDFYPESEEPSSNLSSVEDNSTSEEFTGRSSRQTEISEKPRLKLDRPFLYFVRHNPTGLILHMGRFNPRLLP